jgi:hypothetical protein
MRVGTTSVCIFVSQIGPVYERSYHVVIIVMTIVWWASIIVCQFLDLQVLLLYLYFFSQACGTDQ